MQVTGVIKMFLSHSKAFAFCNRKVCTFLIATMLSAATLSATAQTGATGGELQQKLSAMKQSAAENQQKLHRYQWVETTQLTLKGDAKPASQSLCAYGPD